MALPLPARVLAVDETGAIVEVAGRVGHASTRLLPDVVAGDAVLVAAGTLIRRLGPVEAADLIALLGLARGSRDKPG